ncbi:MAG: hypothetical protein M3Y54_12385 [Bacteroidota bacterium]|nr:hypothetical protein [Bacteroidota bacterium]
MPRNSTLRATTKSTSNLTPAARLWRIKALHTAVWAFFVAAILVVLYGGITNSITVYTWIASGLVVAEGLVLLVFKSHCPLTLLARKYSTSTKDNFDIFLPEWLARYNKLIFSVLYAIGLALVGYRLLS